MQVESLKIFCDVVRLRSFSRGAAANEVLQPTASQTVNQLEKHLGTKLIDRSCRPWKLTNEGEVFYNGCRPLVEQYFNLEASIRHTANEQDSVIRIAAIYSVGLGDMNRYIQSFKEQHPNVSIEIEYLHPDRVFDRVLNGDEDIGFVSFPRPRRDLEIIPWRREPMVLACAPNHRLNKLPFINPTDLSGQKFIAFDKELGIRKEVDRFLKTNKVSVEVTLEFDNIEAIKRAVEINAGVSLLPAPTLAHEVETGTLAAIPLTVNGFVRPVGIIHRRGKKLYPNTLRFIELLQQFAASEGNNHHET
jgi:DNA-binding transcriptional LysR family regulator